MKKAELIAEVAERANRPRLEIDYVLELLGDVAREALLTGKDVPLPGLGKLTLTKRAARVGRNPRTGERIQIPAGKGVKFSSGKLLKDCLKDALD